MTLKDLSARFDRTVAVFTRCQGQVLQKFLTDMIRGILKAQSIGLDRPKSGPGSSDQRSAFIQTTRPELRGASSATDSRIDSEETGGVNR